MNKVILLLALIPNLLFANEEFIIAPQVYLSSSEQDSTLQDNEAVYEFQFHSSNGSIQQGVIHYSIDGEIGKQIMENSTISIRSSAGKHIFQFYYDDRHYEVYTDSLTIQSQHRAVYIVTFNSAILQIEKAKPVIYFYPQKEINVLVKMEIHGDNQFYYPSYTDSWKFTAKPDGDLIFGDKTYNYLFWEATSSELLTQKQTSSGFFVEGSNAVQFLEEKLTEAGLNSKEQADFITFWGPRLMKNKLNFVHFDFNEECNQHAGIEITPKPDNLYRIYMVWGAVSNRFNVTEQRIESIDRSGFSVLEWGGEESDIERSLIKHKLILN